MRRRFALLTGSLLCISALISGKLFSPAIGGAMALHITSPDFSEGERSPRNVRATRRTSRRNFPGANRLQIPRALRSSWMIPTPRGAPGCIGFCSTVPAGAKELLERVPRQEQLAGGARQGRNDFGKIGYSGPCPPPGKPHRYFFKLYALDTKLNLKSRATKADLERAIKPHVLAQTELIGRYGR